MKRVQRKKVEKDDHRRCCRAALTRNRKFGKCGDQIIAKGLRTLAIVLQATGLPAAPAMHRLQARDQEARHGYGATHADETRHAVWLDSGTQRMST